MAIAIPATLHEEEELWEDFMWAKVRSERSVQKHSSIGGKIDMDSQKTEDAKRNKPWDWPVQRLPLKFDRALDIIIKYASFVLVHFPRLRLEQEHKTSNEARDKAPNVWKIVDKWHQAKGEV